ncbi:hypothetical protein XENOCAPTIV_009077 [Xenoophorus captivus]|uniref:Uncharacterized protein n=1 Tax=Xenoophorus captivus TaxID=1517983 RepID=A0ABV0RUN6_9TELE
MPKWSSTSLPVCGEGLWSAAISSVAPDRSRYQSCSHSRLVLKAEGMTHRFAQECLFVHTVIPEPNLPFNTPPFRFCSSVQSVLHLFSQFCFGHFTKVKLIIQEDHIKMLNFNMKCINMKWMQYENDQHGE